MIIWCASAKWHKNNTATAKIKLKHNNDIATDVLATDL